MSTETKRTKREYPLNAKNIFGLSTMKWALIAGASLMTSAFMIYLTDFSNLANAAIVATVLLTVGRIVDAACDPAQGFIMDRSPITKIGKFKPWLLLGIALTTIALIMVFNMPQNVAEWVKILFLSIGYFMFTIGQSFHPDMAMRVTMTDDPKVREKLLVIPRIVEQAAAVPFAFFIPVALLFGDMLGGGATRGFSVAAFVFVLPLAVIALIGALCVREGPFVKQSETKIGLQDLIKMFKTNKPLWISQLSGVFGGSIFPFVMIAVTYYIRWAYGPENFGANAAIMGSCILFGIVVGTLLAPKLFKKIIPVNGAIIATLSQIAPLAIIFLLSLIIDIPLVLFFILLFIMMVFSGSGFIPASLIGMECMDYNRYKQGEGKGMEALVQSVGAFVIKLQTALAGLVTGAVLIAVGYDAALYESEEFIEAGGTVPPELLTGLAIVFCVIPVFLGITAAIILKFYPLKKDERELMYSELEGRR